jgi:hypothetical protein
MSESERKAWGMRLFAIYSGRKTQEMYRLRGIDAMAHARKFRWPKKDDQAKATRSKVLPIA